MTKAGVWGIFCSVATEISRFFSLARGAALSAGGQPKQRWHLMGKKALWEMVMSSKSGLA